MKIQEAIEFLNTATSLQEVNLALQVPPQADDGKIEKALKNIRNMGFAAMLHDGAFGREIVVVAKVGDVNT